MAITSSEAGFPGSEAQTLLRKLTKPQQTASGARRRLGHLIDLDERDLIDLQVQDAYQRGGIRALDNL
jgi:hypothetical protein